MMNDDSQYNPRRDDSENEEGADDAFAHRFPDADMDSPPDVYTPFAPEDTPVRPRPNPLTRRYEPDALPRDASADDADNTRMQDDQMRDANLRDLSAAYAFGATDAAESEELRHSARTDSALAAEIEEFRALHGALHYAAPPVAPPPALHARLRAATQPLDTHAAAPPPAFPPSAAARRSPPAPLFTVPQPTLKVAPDAQAMRGTSAPWPAPRINPLTGKPVARPASAVPDPPVQRFATTPAAPAQQANQQLVPITARQGAFAANTRPAWTSALLALLLFAGATYLWFDQVQSNTFSQTDRVQLQAANDALQNDLAIAQQDLLAARAAQESAQTAMAEAQSTLAAAQTELSTAQSALAASQDQLSTLQTQVSEQLDLQAALVSLLAQTQMQTFALQPSAAATEMTGSARIVWQPETNDGMLVTMEMPPLPEDQVYQLWYLRAGVPYSAGMFTVDDSGKGMLELDSMTIADYDVAAITSEPMGGSPAPTSPILIVGEL